MDDPSHDDCPAYPTRTSSWHGPLTNDTGARSVVAIPARNEAACIVACLEALNGQVGARLDDIVLLANNCTDDTAAIARSVELHPMTRLHVVERALPPDIANAGMARRLAMAAAVPFAGRNGILLTTDADGQVDPDWLGANLAAMAGGADVVAGWAELHPIDWGNIPTRLHEDDAQECAYDKLCDEIHARLDPDPFDPLPRHTQHSGASIAVTASAYARCGGIPAVASGEDRALIAALRGVDARIRHAPEVRVVVSGRILGRAVGGMADTIRRRMTRPDPMLDDRLEPASDCVRRASCRAALRRAYEHQACDLASLARQLGVSTPWLETILAAEFFGQAWEMAESTAPALRRQSVAVSELPHQMAMAETILRTIRTGSALDVAELGSPSLTEE